MGEFASDMYLLAKAYNALQKIELMDVVVNRQTRIAIRRDLIYLQTQILDELQAWAVQRRRRGEI